MRVLEFDHRPGTQKRGDIARLVHELVAWQVILDEIEKCDVRCANCHRRMTAERGGFWRHRWHDAHQQAFNPGERLAAIMRVV